MLEPKGGLVNIEIGCVSAVKGITPEELVDFIKKGYMYLDVLPVRREITAQEKLTTPKIPPAATHTAEPMMIFYKISPAVPPLPGKVVEPGVN